MRSPSRLLAESPTRLSGHAARKHGPRGLKKNAATERREPPCRRSQGDRDTLSQSVSGVLRQRAQEAFAKPPRFSALRPSFFTRREEGMTGGPDADQRIRAMTHVCVLFEN